jgi:lipopolysaccharide transport system permease protein
MSVSEKVPANLKVYTPDAAILKPGRMLREMKADLMASKGLAWRLAVRDISAQYRQSILGYVWAFLLPLVNTATWLFLNTTGIVQVSPTEIPYPVYVFTGTMLWQVFTESLQSPLIEVGAAKGMLSKLNFPREALLLSGILKALFNAGIKVIILIPAIILMGVYPGWQLLLFPLAILSILLVGNAIGLLLAPTGILYHDVGKTIPILTQFAMYITPVVFAMPDGGFIEKLFRANFMTPVIITARNWLTGLDSGWLGYFLGVNGVAFILLLAGWIIFRITIPILIERMSA